MFTRRFLITLITFLILTLLAGLILFLARGYRVDVSERTISGTGIILVTSTPDGALVYLNNVPQDATNTTIRNLKPDTYRLRVEKQGFAPWEKEVAVEAEIVSEEHALLVPLFPELKPLTFTGAKNPLLAPDGQKIAFQSQTNGEAGLYLLELTERAFNLTNQPILLAADKPEQMFSRMQIAWFPDSTALLLTQDEEIRGTVPLFKAWQLDLATRTITVLEKEELGQLQARWQTEKETAKKAFLESLAPEHQQKLAQIDNYRWSLDNSKILFQSTGPEGQTLYQVLNLKPQDLRQKEPVLTTAFTDTGPNQDYLKVEWFPNSQHLLILEKESLESASGRVFLVEIEGTNLTQVFEGALQGETLIPHPGGGSLIILTSFNPASQQHNLYSINLR